MEDEEKSGCLLPYELPTFDNWSPIATFYHPLMAGSIDGTDTMPHDKAVIRASKSLYKPNKKVNFIILTFLELKENFCLVLLLFNTCLINILF